MMGKRDLVDDLKTAVSQKYPNTIAKFHDASELRIYMGMRRNEQVKHPKSFRNKSTTSRIKSDFGDETLNKNASSEDPSHDDMPTFLESDKNVWEILDEYFGADMRMSEALIIDVTKDTPNGDTPHQNDLRYHEVPQMTEFEQLYSPSPSQSIIHKPFSSTSSLQTPKPRNPQQVSKVLEKHYPDSPRHQAEVSPITNTHTHRRSQSSPSQSPVSLTSQTKSSNSQAVLLLPKNFSLGEQQSSKRLSLDENFIRNSTIKQRNNVSNIGERLSQTQLDPSTKDGSALNEDDASEIKFASSAKLTPKCPDQTTTSLEPDRKGSISSLKLASKTYDSKRDKMEKTLNTSTFEQVLPSISVLVVEDNSINQAILGAFLRKHKIHYQIAKNGQEAVDKWRTGGFHLVLMDIQLPVKSGIEATKEIRYLEKVNRIGVFAQHELHHSQSSEYPRLKDEEKLDLNVFRSPVIIVALTASSNSSVDKKNALTAGCNDFLTKPVNLVWLQNKITEWGCMQALIDFDGWRCKGRTSTPPSVKVAPPSS
ncbi:hypothetical protein OXX69_006302 [Metschnikowia pulcherrima]